MRKRKREDVWGERSKERLKREYDKNHRRGRVRGGFKGIEGDPGKMEKKESVREAEQHARGN